VFFVPILGDNASGRAHNDTSATGKHGHQCGNEDGQFQPFHRRFLLVVEQSEAPFINNFPKV
jgi:hypothetical protein